MIDRTKNVEMKLAELEKATAQYVILAVVFALVQHFGKPTWWGCFWSTRLPHFL